MVSEWTLASGNDVLPFSFQILSIMTIAWTGAQCVFAAATFFCKTGQFVIIRQRAFCLHFILCRNDVVPDRKLMSLWVENLLQQTVGVHRSKPWSYIKENNKALARRSYHYHLPKFTRTSNVTVDNVEVISAASLIIKVIFSAQFLVYGLFLLFSVFNNHFETGYFTVPIFPYMGRIHFFLSFV